MSCRTRRRGSPRQRGVKFKTESKEKWFHPEKQRGWRKTDGPGTRCANVFASTDKRKSLHDRYLEAARAMQALANVTKDEETRRKAQADADYFYRKAREA